MDEVARFFESLCFAPDRERKQACLERFLRTEHSDRGWVISILTGGGQMPRIRRKRVLEHLLEFVDEGEFKECQKFVGDALETMALLWPDKDDASELQMALGDLIAELSDGPTEELFIEKLDQANGLQRWMLFKVLVGRGNWGLDARAVIEVIAKLRGVEPRWLEARWHGFDASYDHLIRWIDGVGEMPDVPEGACFHPMPIFESCEMKALSKASPSEFTFREHPQGIRVQLVVTGPQRKLYDEEGADISHGFPDILEAATNTGVWIAVIEDLSDSVECNAIRKRLSRKKITPQLVQSLLVRLVILETIAGVDVESMPCEDHPLFRRADSFPIERWEDLKTREASRLLICPKSTGSEPTRWFTPKMCSHCIELVMLYTGRGTGLNGASTITLGLRSGDGWLPLAEAPAEFHVFDHDRVLQWVKDNKIARYGPVTEVKKELVIEIEYGSLKLSPRRKAGIFFEDPVIRQVKWEQPPDNLMDLDQLKARFQEGKI